MRFPEFGRLADKLKPLPEMYAREHYALRDALFAGGSADPPSMASWNPSCAAACKFRFR